MGLQTYKRKRHFNRTPEPTGKVARRGGHAYVIQKHDASHLHYDFRLELDGVLKSWAVPKGPSLDPARKRLAVQVEDHPVEYGSFEGSIPEGEYGGGTVMLWDRGDWEPVGDPREGLRNGKFKFQLHGEKLQGGWMLVRRGGRGPSEKEQREWLLFKERDEAARPESEEDVLEELPLSVSTGRNLDEIAADRDRVWNSHAKSNGRSTATRSTTHKAGSGRAGKMQAARRAKTKTASPGSEKRKRSASRSGLPVVDGVQLATLTKQAPDGEEWVHEIKFDGYRMLCRIDGNHVEFVSRNDQQWTGRLPSLVQSVLRLPVQTAILDGEVVALRDDGVSDFQELQNAFRDGREGTLQYYLFDLLFVDGENLMSLPLEDRRQRLAELLQQKDLPSNLHFSESIEGHGRDFLKQACGMGLEGIISKRKDRPYAPGRGYDWLKVKCVQTEEFVIGGFTDPSGARSGFGALLVGYYDSDAKLRYAGKVGTGFDEKTLHTLYERLQALEQDKSPFVNLQRRTGPVRTAHWVRPELVGQFRFGSWTRDELLRHAAFLGLREDKPAREVVRDKALPLSTALSRADDEDAADEKGTAQAKRSRTPRKKSTSEKSAVPAKTSARQSAPPRTVKSAGAKTSSRSESDGSYDAKQEAFSGVRLTSPDKVLYPEAGITKLDLAHYYQTIADWILPHIADRPLVLVRCPKGRETECFYQKHPAIGTPKNLRRIPIKEKSGTEDYVIVDDVSGLISLVQIGALEIHAWGSRADKLEQPDRLVFDLDPDPELPWKRVVESARQVREFLQALELESFVKTTGGKGLHLVVPIERRQAWPEVKAFCKQVIESIAAADPDSYTPKMTKALRTGKIYLDYLRNDRGATSVVAYSTRARPGAPVSTPLTWQELSSRTPSNHYTVQNLPKRLASLARDPWEALASTRQSLSKAMAKMKKLSGR